MTFSGRFSPIFSTADKWDFFSQNAIAAGGFPPVVGAAQEGHAEVVQALANAGANLELKNPEGFTALVAAAEGGHGIEKNIFLH